MRTLFIAGASALFFAAVITELSMRLWPDQYLPLLLVAFVALFLTGLLNLRLAGWLGSSGPDTRGRRDGRNQRGRARCGRARSGRARSGRGRADTGGATPERRDKKRNDIQSGGQRPSEPPPTDAERETGTVKWFNRSKGFGFVIRPSGEEIFVHQRSIRATGEGDNRRRPALKDGQTISFVVVQREKGLQAEDVVPEE